MTVTLADGLDADSFPLPTGPHLQHLTTKAQFQAVMSGPTVARTPHFALHLVPLGDSAERAPLFAKAVPWVGVILPKRWARRAVTRNTIRRQIYEIARTRQADMPVAAMVVRLRSEFSRKSFISATSDALKLAVREELLSLYQKMQLHPPSRPPVSWRVGGGAAVVGAGSLPEPLPTQEVGHAG